MGTQVVLGLAGGAIIGGAIAYLTRARGGKGLSNPGARAVRGAVLGALLGGLAFQLAPLLTGAGYGPDVSPITSQEQFRSEVLQAEVPVLVDFYKNGCPPCAKLAPTLDALADEYGDKARFVKVDVAARPALAREYGVKYTPTVVLFVNGEPARWVVGAKPAETYRGMLAEATGIPEGQGQRDS
jgi:thioredoxin 1